MLSPRILMLGLALSGVRDCRREEPTADPVILRLDDQTLRKSEFEERVAQLTRRGADASVRTALLRPYLEERILVLEARQRGLLKPGAPREDEKAAVEALLARSVAPADVTESDIARYYEDHRDEFQQPERITVRQILVPTENEARDVRRRLQHGPTSFDLLARTRSRSPEASTGGLMGTFERGQLPTELDTAAFSLAAGATSDIVVTPLGYHVLRIDARQPAREQSLDESRSRIRSHLLQERTAKGVAAFVQQLFSRAKVNDEAALSVRPLS
jgi:parvulin-like peptidyl-prolyl isomerase